VLLINEQIDSDRWEDLLIQTDDYSPFQTEEFHTLFNATEGLHSDVFAIEENSAYLCLAVVTVQKEKGLLSFFSARGIVYGGILIRPDNVEALDILLNGINDFYRNKLIYIEIRNSFDYSTYSHVFEKNGWEYLPWLNILKEISGSEDLHSELSESRRRQIRKALGSGITSDFAKDITEIKAFYRILSILYSNKINKPLLPFSFFKRAFESRFSLFLLVKYAGRIIGGIMLVPLQGKAVYEFYVCGLDAVFREQYPSVVSTWAGIEYARLNKIPVFDFMGAGSPDKEYGVRDFKKRFGGRLVEHGRYIKICSPVLYRIGKTGLNIIKIPKLIKQYAF